jgi:nucleotide sugar dehydrogenase
MKVCVYGLLHLGAVTAACLGSRKIQTIGLAETRAAAEELSAGRAPLYEPGHNELIGRGIASGSLSFTADIRDAVSSADVVWVTFDTPVDEDDVADVDYVLDCVRSLFPHFRDGTVILISSQVPVGSTARLKGEFEAVANGRTVSFAYSPENLRLGDAIRIFTEPERIVIGVRDTRARDVLEPLLRPFEIYGQPGKLEINCLGGSYGVERLTYYKMLPEMGPPETTSWEYPMADNSWKAGFAEFLEDIIEPIAFGEPNRCYRASRGRREDI